MKEQIKKSDGILEIIISEKLTFEDHNKFRELLKMVNKDQQSQCQINLKHLESIDSAGLGMLMIAFETAEKEGVGFEIRSPTGQVKRLLEISQFDRVMTITHD
ncbi:STAS domain-containing protein [Sneathiella sp.]|jgi:anti-anti-sigma factor|uniref:STAS domain-containing protein n=1 Tax=Sneathiella sp. TaxID=1964365 RepID=UPI0039E35A96